MGRLLFAYVFGAAVLPKVTHALPFGNPNFFSVLARPVIIVIESVVLPRPAYREAASCSNH